jgi:hypothetical protein
VMERRWALCLTSHSAELQPLMPRANWVDECVNNPR